MTARDPVLDGLNPSQREAVLYRGGPLLILAGAGSGKTRVLTHRVAHFIREGVLPFQVLAVTFTNKAASVMRERIAGLVHCAVSVSTFHSCCLKMLRAEAGRLQFPRSFTVYDDHDQRVIIKECMAELGLNVQRMSPRGFHEAISRAKDELMDPVSYARSATDRYQDAISRVYALYQKKLMEFKGMDFGDLIMHTVRLLEEHADLRASYQEQFQHIFVDEYQDTNHAQYRFVRLLTSERGHITVVGDPDQSIYAWRGADVDNILDFEREFSDVKVVKLEQNYRSTSTILDAANAVIQHNVRRKEKSLWSERGEGESIELYEAVNEKDEARNTVERIVSYRLQGTPLKDIVVFYRIHAQSRPLEDELRKHNIQYKIVGGVRFYDRREIKDLIAYLRVVQTPEDAVSLKRIINVPARGLGKKSITLLEEEAARRSVALYEVLGPGKLPAGISGKSQKALTHFHAFIERLRREKEEKTLTDMMQEIIDQTGYMDALEEEKTMEAKIRIENIKEFFSVIDEFENVVEEDNRARRLEAFLEQITLTSAVDGWEEELDTLTLMTLHSAKGMEFPVVFMLGLEEGLFPHSYSGTESAEDLEEERRLFYVGVTRARDRLHVSFANTRFNYGSRSYQRPSRFLSEIPQTLMTYSGSGGGVLEADEVVEENFLDESSEEVSEPDYDEAATEDTPF